MRKKLILIAVLILIIVSFFSIGASYKNQTTNRASITQIVKDSVSYKGENGKDALVLLKNKYQISQDGSGLVVSIGGRKADLQKHEYWAFYVNGKMASVGPADYKTKDADLIEWKIEKY